MIKKLFVLLVIVSIAAPCFAQTVDTAWVRRYDGLGNSDDDAYAIAVDDSGNVYVTGRSYGIGGTKYDYATVKYDASGNELWVGRYNGPDSGSDYAYALAVDDSGNVYVTGGSQSGIQGDYATIKYELNGDTIWVRRYNGPGNDYDKACAIAADGSGNVYVTGESSGSGTDYDYATIKYFPNGDTSWVRRYDGPVNGEDYAYAMAVDGSGNVYVTGRSTGSGTGFDCATIKYYTNGDTAWIRRYDGPDSQNDAALAIAVDDSGNVYMTGVSWGSGTGNDYLTVKYYPNGDTVWVRKYNGPGNDIDGAYAIALDDSYNIYVTGESEGSGTGYDYATIKYYPNGDTAWVRRYTGLTSGHDTPCGIAVDDSGNVYVTGTSHCSMTNWYSYATIGYDASGNELWVEIYEGTDSEDDLAEAIVVDDSGNVYVTGESRSLATSSEYATIKYYYPPPPTADFVGNPLIGEKDLLVSFTDSSEGEIDSWYWSFGDGYSSIRQNPVHTYKQAGTYNVKLIVTNQFGSDTLIREDYIQVLAKPLADFAVFTPPVSTPDLIGLFNDNSIGNPTFWKWYSGEGDSLVGPYSEFVHVYENPGTYDVTMIATSANGSDTVTKRDFIYVFADSLGGDTVKVLEMTAVPNQEDVRIPIILTVESDSLRKIDIPLTFTDTSLVHIDSVSFENSRFLSNSPHSVEDTVIDVNNEQATIFVRLSTSQPPFIKRNDIAFFLGWIYLKVKDVPPNTEIVFQETTIDSDSLLYVTWDGVEIEPGFSPGTLFVEKAESVPPETPQNLVALPLESGISLTWDAVTDPDLRLYAIYRNTSMFTPGSLDDTLATSLEPFYLDSGVSSGETYFYRVSALDSSWNESEYSDTASATFGDLTPPVITVGPTVIAISDTMATFYWETDEEADGYGQIYIDTNWVTADSHMTYLLEHTATVTWLEPSTSYPFRVHSTDSLDNGPTYSDTGFLTTMSGPDVTPPQIIFGPAVVYKTHNSATIQWTTNETANSTLFYWLKGQSYPDRVVDLGFVTSHSLTLNGLFPESTYYYAVSSVDPSGNGPTYSENFYATCDTPRSVFSVDLDGDLDLDLAVVNGGSDNVSILKNTGNGTFESKVDYGVGDSPTSVFCADLDGDEDLDLAVTNSGSDSVSILKNNGDGTFQAKVDYGTGNSPRSVFCSDLDSDEDFDLAIANSGSDNVSVLKNNGDGSFQAKVDYDAGDEPFSVFSALLNEDEDLDLAVANRVSDSISIFINYGDGTFQAKSDYGSGSGPRSVFCADFDSDFDWDLAVANSSSYDVSILKNNGDASFQTKVDYDAGCCYATDIFSEDIDGDSHLDLAVANFSGYVSILKNNGNGTFQTKQDYVTGCNTISVFCADLDGDLDLDLAVVNMTMDNVYILLNNGDGTYPEPPSFTTEAASDGIPPAIVQGPVHSGITDNKAVISWVTDEISTSVVQYGPSQLYGSERVKSDYVQSHQIVLTNLQDSTLYHYRVGSVDPESNGPTWSSNFWFWTKGTPDSFAPIILSGPFASWINDTQAQIDWTTHELSNSWVHYGLDLSYGSIGGNPSYATEHSVVLTNLVPDTTYYYYISSTDLSGNTTESAHTGGGGAQPLDTGDDQFTTRASPDVTAPVIISGPHVRHKTHNQALVEWVTDETGNSIVEYGETQGYGTVLTYPQATINHSAYLTNLNPSTTYHFRVGSKDIAKNGPTYSSDMTFTTSGDVPDIYPPVITVAPGIAYLDQTMAIIEWETDEPADSYMGYELIGGLAERIVGESFSYLEHRMMLSLESSYNVRVFSSDAYGNGPTYSDYFVVTAPTSADVDPPVLTSGPEVIYTSQNSAKIGWETDELSSSFIEYGLSEEYTDIEGNPDNDSLHEVILTNLTASTTYHYRVKSADLFGNIYLGTDSTFTTEGSSDLTPPATPEGLSSSYGNQWTKLTWNENQEGDLSGYNLHRGTVYPGALPLIASNLADSSYKDQGLVNGVTYYYQLTAVDQSSNESSPTEVICSKPLTYIAGDFNGDQTPDVVDVVAMVNYLFKGAEGHEPLEAGNVNGDEEVTISDAVYLINYLFKDGTDPCICTIPDGLLARYQERSKAILGLCFPFEDNSKDVEVMLEVHTEEEVAGIQIDLFFDPSKVEVKEISRTSRTENLGLYYSIESGKVKIGMVDIYGANILAPGEGSILKIKFQKKNNQAGISSVKIDRAIVVNPSAQELNVQIEPNKVIRSIPQTFSLAQNYPNPFNARTVIKYSLPKDSKVEIAIYNILGRKVKTLVNEHQQAGYKTVVWDGKNQKGNEVASGVYFYRITADDFVQSKKMLLLK